MRQSTEIATFCQSLTIYVNHQHLSKPVNHHISSKVTNWPFPQRKLLTCLAEWFWRLPRIRPNNIKLFLDTPIYHALNGVHRINFIHDTFAQICTYGVKWNISVILPNTFIHKFQVDDLLTITSQLIATRLACNLARMSEEPRLRKYCIIKLIGSNIWTWGAPFHF